MSTVNNTIEKNPNHKTPLLLQSCLEVLSKIQAPTVLGAVPQAHPSSHNTAKVLLSIQDLCETLWGLIFLGWFYILILIPRYLIGLCFVLASFSLTNFPVFWHGQYKAFPLDRRASKHSACPEHDGHRPGCSLGSGESWLRP